MLEPLSANQCALIAQIIPVFLLTLIVERRWAFNQPPPRRLPRIWNTLVVFVVLNAEGQAIIHADSGADGADAILIWVPLLLLGWLVLANYIVGMYFPDDNNTAARD